MHHIAAQSARAVGLIFVLGASLVLFSAPAHGQVTIKPGVRIGVNSATVGGDTDEYVQAFSDLGGGSIFDFDVEVEMGRRTGVLVGGYALVDFAGPLALQPELRYVHRGFGYDVTISFQEQSSTASGSLNLRYLEIPLTARLQLPVGIGVSPHVFGGPTVGVNLSAESETESAQGGSSRTTDVSDEVSDTELGLEVGGGVDVPLGVGTVTVDLRYGLGFTNIIDTEETELSLNNRALMVTAGLTF